MTPSGQKTPEYAWLLENAHRYGWILRYPEDKTEITGYNFEPWHFRYVGTELAAYLKEQDLVLEEYYGALPTTNLLAVPEEYWPNLSEEDYAFMMKELEDYAKKQEEAAQQPTPIPEPTPEPGLDDPAEPEISPTPEADNIPTPGIDGAKLPGAEDTFSPDFFDTPAFTPTPTPPENDTVIFAPDASF